MTAKAQRHANNAKHILPAPCGRLPIRGGASASRQPAFADRIFAAPSRVRACAASSNPGR
jgi:hypothetical protein